MAETIGQQLKQARTDHHLSLEKAAEATRIRQHYLEAIEADEFDELPSPVQARAFLRLYAGYLGLSLDELIARQAGGAAEATLTPVPIAPAMEKAPVADAPAGDPSIPAPAKPRLADRLTLLLARLKRKAKLPVETEAVSAEEAAPAEETPMEAVPEVETPAPKKETGASTAVFAAIGQALRQRREMLSLTLEEIERHTHVRVHYLQALEEGDFNHLPSSVQGRGMLANYARFLDMDADSLLLQFAEGLQALRVERQPQAPAKAARESKPKTTPRASLLPAGLRRFLSMDLLVGGGLVVLLLAFAIWGTSRIIGMRQAGTPQPTAPSISDILGMTPTGGPETPTPTLEAGAATLAPGVAETAVISIPANGPGVVHVVIVALQSAWVQVTVDQKLQFQGRVNPGTAYPYDANTQIEVRTGNGAAVSILYNESDLGVMGAMGEVVDHIYTADAIVNPTPTFTPSPTITPKPSITPRPSATTRPSSTPRPTVTPKK